jgi:phenylacetic acid degradation protein
MSQTTAGIYSFEGRVPTIDPTAFVHPAATLIGNVSVAARCYVGPGAVLRGDFGRIVMKAGSNVQDNCVAHSFPDWAVIVEEDGHVGHGAVLHGCIVGRNALVGMKAVVMDRAVIGTDAVVAAAALVPTGFEVPARMLAAGIPAVVQRPLTDDDIRRKSAGTRLYQELAARCLRALVRCDPQAPA